MKYSLSRNFYCSVVFICLFNELFDGISIGVPNREYVVDVTFPNKQLIGSLSRICVSICIMKILAKAFPSERLGMGSISL